MYAALGSAGVTTAAAWQKASAVASSPRRYAHSPLHLIPRLDR